MCLYYDCIISGPVLWISVDALRTSGSIKMKCVPANVVAEQLPNLVLSIILGFHALT